MYLNTEQDGLYYKFVIYGDNGTGKTTMGVSSPEPVVLLSERQGWTHVVKAAAMLGKPVPPTFWIEDREQLLKAVMILKTQPDACEALCDEFISDPTAAAKAIEALPYKHPQTVVIDSATEMFQLISDDLDKTAPPKTAKDGLPERAMRYWSTLKDRSNGFIRAVRDLPFHVVMLALKEDKETGEGDEKSRVVAPMAPMRAIGPMLGAAANAVGIAEVKRKPPKKDQEMGMQWQVRFAAPSFMLTKPLRPLKDVESPDISDWIVRLEAGDGSSSL